MIYFIYSISPDNKPIDFFEVRDVEASAQDLVFKFDNLDEGTKYSIYYFAAERLHPLHQGHTPLVTYTRNSDTWDPPQLVFDEEESRGAEVGVGIGVVFGILLLVVILACIIVKCSGKKVIAITKYMDHILNISLIYKNKKIFLRKTLLKKTTEPRKRVRNLRISFKKFSSLEHKRVELQAIENMIIIILMLFWNSTIEIIFKLFCMLFPLVFKYNNIF